MFFFYIAFDSHHLKTNNTMGQSLSEAKKAESGEGLQALEEIAKQKMESYILRAQAARGSAPKDKETEIGGGRSFIRVAQTRVAMSDGLDKQITTAVDDFFVSAGLASKGDESAAKTTAINGASKLAKAALKSIVGASSGTSAETNGFEVLFVKGAFIRVDYFLYHYRAKGQAWFTEKKESLYVTLMDSSILDASMLKPAERTFLIARAIDYSDGSSFDKVEDIETDLAKLTLFSKLIDTLSKTAIKNPESFTKFVGIIDRAKLILEKDKTKIEDKAYVGLPISVFEDPPKEQPNVQSSAGSKVVGQVSSPLVS